MFEEQTAHELCDTGALFVYEGRRMERMKIHIMKSLGTA